MNKKTTMNHKKQKSLIAVFVCIFIFVFICALIAFLFATSGAKSLWNILSECDYWLTIGVVNGFILISYLLMYRVDAQDIAIKENDLEDTEWLTYRKLKKMREFKVYKWENVNEKEDGIVIAAEKKNSSIGIVTTDQLHAIIVGTTGSGKSTGFVDQNIEVLAHSKNKPSLIITDPKKELYEKHNNQLIKEGYKVSVLDLREPYSSAHWNPMNVLIRRIIMVKDLENNLVNKDGKYFGAGETFLSYRDARTRLQELKDEIYENAQDLVYTICPVQNKDQPTWEEGARNLILGLVLAFCEDCIDGKMEEKQLLLFNIYHNITKYCSEDTTVLKQYLLDNRDEFSKVRGLVNTVLITSDKTLTSYLSEVNSYMQQLSDDGILSLTSENDFEIIKMDEDPNAVFIIVPDERFTRHRFVTLFITQLYKELVEKANLNLRRQETNTAILKRNTYFVLDEFGNLPKFENMEGMVTVARSRAIRFLYVLQSFSQLTARYGKEVGDIIKANCNVKIFIGSDDPDTRKEFSELCGQKKIKNFSVSTNADTPASSNTGATNQPLITPGMLERLNGDKKGDAIISVRGYEPIWTKFTPSYELEKLYFKEGKADVGKREAIVFDKLNYVYDISGLNGELETDKILEIIEQSEMLPNEYDAAQKKELDELDRKWDEMRNKIEDKISEISVLLKNQDAKAVRAAALENKVAILLSFMGNYDLTIAQKIQQIAKYIENTALPYLKDLQSRVK